MSVFEVYTVVTGVSLLSSSVLECQSGQGRAGG